MEIRMYPSDPQYPEYRRLVEWLARLRNPSCWWGMGEMPDDLLSKSERLVAIKDVEDALEELAH
jgi:hypothetical protein